MRSWTLPNAEATSRFGVALGARLRGGEAIALVGDLGAGKTTMTQAIARGMGITAHVTSPTFGLVHEYPGPIPLFHFDTYRLERAEDLYGLGFLEYFERQGVVVVEWADKFPELLPTDRLILKLTADTAPTAEAKGEDAPRTLVTVADGAYYQSLLTGLAQSQAVSDLLGRCLETC